MTREATLMSGIILIALPGAQYGGYFLLTALMDQSSRYMDNPLRQNFFRAGHAHAAVILLLALICQILADAAMLPAWLLWFVRIGVPAASILMGPGFFLSMPSPDALKPNRLVRLISVGAATLALSIVILGIGLLRSFAAR
jgi:hypothetical protein